MDVAAQAERMQHYRNCTKGIHKSMKKFEESIKMSANDLASVSEELRKLASLDTSEHREFGRAITQLSGTLKSISGIQIQSANAIENKIVGLTTFVDYDFQELNESLKRRERLNSEYEALMNKIQSGVKNVGDPESLKMKIDSCVMMVTKNLAILEIKKDTRLLQTLIDTTDEYFVFEEKVLKLLAHLKKRTCEIGKHLDETYQFTRPLKEGMVLRHRKGEQQKVFLAIREGKIFQFQAEKEFKPENSLDCMTCTVRPVMEDVKKFEILAPQIKKPWSLEAENETERDEWIKAIQVAVSGRLNSLNINQPKLKAETGVVGSNTSSTLTSTALSWLQRIAGNGFCVDCSAPGPDWASINFGALFCLECSGVHRAMGTHVSKVRSLTLDKWSPEMLLYMSCSGNKVVNDIFEANLQTQKISQSTERSAREQWIKSKYEQKKFISPSPSPPEDTSKALYKEIQNCGTDVTVLLKLLAQGADTNWPCPTEDNRTALHQAAIGGNIIATEFLIQNGASAAATDAWGSTPLHYAAFHNNPRTVLRLLQANQKMAQQGDSDGLDALSVAALNDSFDAVNVLKGPTDKYDMSFDLIMNTPADDLIKNTYCIPKRLHIVCGMSFSSLFSSPLSLPPARPPPPLPAVKTKHADSQPPPVNFSPPPSPPSPPIGGTLRPPRPPQRAPPSHPQATTTATTTTTPTSNTPQPPSSPQNPSPGTPQPPSHPPHCTAIQTHQPRPPSVNPPSQTSLTGGRRLPVPPNGTPPATQTTQPTTSLNVSLALKPTTSTNDPDRILIGGTRTGSL
ncbi:centaurin beta [Pelomyxa schiedti]|nr:centaurin beta [Pelomyxa schiedti]